MATKKQKREAAQQKRKEFLEAEAARHAKNLEKVRGKREHEQFKTESQERRKTASKKAKKLPRVNTRPHDDGHIHTALAGGKCLHCGVETSGMKVGDSA